MLLLGDGYSLRHISEGWNSAVCTAKIRGVKFPERCPALGVACYWEAPRKPWAELPNGYVYWVACAAFYPTEGEWMIAEHLAFSVNATLPPRVKNEAFKRAVPAMLAIATVHGKRLLFPSSSKGVTAILRNMGVAYSTGLDLLVTP